jgi:hypothetical protein
LNWAHEKADILKAYHLRSKHSEPTMHQIGHVKVHTTFNSIVKK